MWYSVVEGDFNHKSLSVVSSILIKDFNNWWIGSYQIMFNMYLKVKTDTNIYYYYYFLS